MRQQWVLAATACLCVVALIWSLPAVKQADARYRAGERPVILIDPGHGGADGGATGVDGTGEKDVNLSVSRSLAAVLWVMGQEVRMTRVDDRSVHSPEAGTLREQKVSDMHNRLAMYEQASLVVSIHQNQFTQSQYSGAQVFYAPKNEQSRVLATHIRERVLALLQPENKRELKRADDSLFLLSNATVPVALVECGFLSNPEECRKLADPTYQRQMAFAVAGGILAFRGL
ncbi:MAG: N-acetylmuramoyl-L-alanine amidase [Clostridia bacterium]|nr:N-acetylmuramoyl-L-alanine amidase [Clostridia bacterium]